MKFGLVKHCSGTRKRLLLWQTRKSAWIAPCGTRKSLQSCRERSSSESYSVAGHKYSNNTGVPSFHCHKMEIIQGLTRINNLLYFTVSCQKSKTRGFTPQHMTTARLTCSWDAVEERSGAHAPHRSPHIRVSTSVSVVRKNYRITEW